ncbi:hypothetical protein GWK47_002050 [Chionoecetes opilio]|uniref:Uncharacterized protein n=1 Tax=Chionoecetes opilio TaxID=41210 RepID=A0A8J4XQL6_CHIOP|nr:hypothetical protein GWK47_002050 [Chionoecetes opilio]
MGGVDSVLAAQETRQSLRLEKGPLLSPPANKKRRRFLICGAARVLAVVQLQHFSGLSQMKNTERWRSEPCEAGERGPTKNIVSPALAATLDETKLTDRSATYV